MNRRFVIGFLSGLLIFLGINLLAAHLASDCGLPAVSGRDSCADDIARAGWPLLFYEDGGFVYRQNFNVLFLLINLGTGLALAAIFGWLLASKEKTLPK
jgi:hypothetical protein